MKNNLKKIHKLISSKRFIILTTYICLVLFTIVSTITFSNFISRNEDSVANMKVADMNYNLVINGNQTTIIYASNNNETIANIIINSLNNVNSKYELIYNVCSNEECTSLIETPNDLIVEYSSRTIDEVTGIIEVSEFKQLRIAITNNTSTGYYLKFGINAGYIHNTLDLENLITTEYNEEDVTIAAIIDGEVSTTFPTIQGDYITQVTCTTNDGPSNATGTAIWNETKWVVHITGVDSGKTICNVNFNQPLVNKILAQGGGTAAIEAKGTPDFTQLSPKLIDYKEVTNDYTSTLTSNNNKAIGSGYTFNASTGIYSLTNYETGKSYGTGYINWYTCDSTSYSNCAIMYKINAVSGSTITNSTKYISESNYDYSDTGIYASEDDYGTSYYYRGDKETLNNNLIFGGFQWKIIRINGDGTIRIIYNGTEEQFNSNGEMNTTGSVTTIGSGPWNITYNNDAKYPGYMYGGANGTASTQRNGTSSSAATYNETPSNAKTKLDEWYQANISDESFEINISDNLFCNDRQMHHEVGGSWQVTSLGYGTNQTYFAARHRLTNSYIPTLKCGLKNDRFTKNDTTKGNGALRYPIGLITIDEASMGGLIYSQSSIPDSANFLYINLSYWSISPFWQVSSGTSTVMTIYKNYGINSGLVSSSRYFRPVISLSSNTAVTGTGTATDPFIAT